MTRKLFMRRPLAILLVSTSFVVPSVLAQQPSSGPTVLQPTTIYEADSVSSTSTSASDPIYREQPSYVSTTSASETGYSSLDDGRKVIYGADGTVYVEDSIGSNTFSSLTVDTVPVSQSAPLSSSTYSSDVSQYDSNSVVQGDVLQGEVVQENIVQYEYEYRPGSGPVTQQVTTPIQASLPVAAPALDDSFATDPARAPYQDPYESQYGTVRGSAAPGVGQSGYGQPNAQPYDLQNGQRSVAAPQSYAPSPAPQPYGPTTMQQGNYLDWAKNERRLRGRAKNIQRLIEDSSDTIASFMEDDNHEPLWRMAKDAKAIVIAPRIYRGGLIVGGSGGNAIMMARTKSGQWSEPAFYTIGSASLGLQVGGDVSEAVLLIMTDRGKEQFLSSSFKVGGDVGIAAGPYGVGGKAQLTDVVAFTQAKGLYGGISLEGAVIKARYEWNDLYYGKEISTADILIRNQAYNPNSRDVQTATTNMERQALALSPVDY